MRQTHALIDTLKKTLKQNQLTYADISKRLNMSEANVKRLFASKRFSLDRLEDICLLMNMELSDLFLVHEENRQKITSLTYEQEENLVKDIKLLLVAVSVRNHLTYDDILNTYDITQAECIHCLATLDKLKIIDLLPQNRIKLLIDENFRWISRGPIERFYEKNIQGQFLGSSFNGELSQRLFLFGLLSEGSAQILKNRLQSLAKEFTELQRHDVRLSLNKRQTIGLMLAMRPWNSDIFLPMSKNKP